MDERGVFVQKILFIHTVFIYTGCVHFVPFGGRKFDRRNEVLAETGGAVSALTPEEHTVLRQQIPRIIESATGRWRLNMTGIPWLATGGGKVRQPVVLLNQRRRVWAEWISLF